MKYSKYEVDKPFPGPIPPTDGFSFEFGPDGGMILIVQYRKPTVELQKALEFGFIRYAIYEHPDILTMCWVFQFPRPVHCVDAPFHAGLYIRYTDDRVGKFLADETHNLMTFVLDGNILKIIRQSVLRPEAMAKFRDIVCRQATQPITREHYKDEIDLIYQYTPEQLLAKGSVFLHKGEPE